MNNPTPALLSKCSKPQQVAIVAMLVAAAFHDGEVAAAEREKILQLMGRSFELPPAAATPVLDLAIDQAIQTTSLSVLLGDLGHELTLAQKQEVLLMLLRVIAADGHQSAEEIDLISQASDSLRLSDQDTHEVYNRYFAERGTV